MRPWLALMVAAAILGGLQAYMSLRPRAAVPAEVQAAQAAAGRFRVQLVATSALGPDPFALEPSQALALELLLRGEAVHRRTQPLAAGEPVVLEGVRGLVSGGNEFFIAAHPQDAESPVPLAVRLRILRDERVVAEQTLWAEAGEPVRGTVRLELPRQDAPAEAVSAEAAPAEAPPFEAPPFEVGAGKEPGR